MAEPQILSTLRRNRGEIEAAIAGLIEAARPDLAAVAAAIRLFEVNSRVGVFKSWRIKSVQNSFRCLNRRIEAATFDTIRFTR
jgi:hypothetical protein